MSSTGSNILVMVFMVAIVAPFLVTFGRMRSEKRKSILDMKQKAESEDKGGFYNDNGEAKSLDDLSPEEYRALLHRKLHHRRH